MIKTLRKGAWIRRDGDHRVIHVNRAEKGMLYITTHQASNGAVLGFGYLSREDAMASLKSQNAQFCDPPSWYKRGA
jgi:hypothetical protein